MVRNVANPLISCFSLRRTRLLSAVSHLPARFKHGGSATEEELAAARRWLSQFGPETIPKNICEVSFSRSSGPGGQNVNKVNSKATLRLPLESLFPLVPKVLHQEIRKSRFYATKSHSLIIQADDSRKQGDNVQSCFSRLHDLILNAAAAVLPGETSEEQRQHVRQLQRRENEARIQAKKRQGIKKASRKGSAKGSDY